MMTKVQRYLLLVVAIMAATLFFFGLRQFAQTEEHIRSIYLERGAGVAWQVENRLRQSGPVKLDEVLLSIVGQREIAGLVVYNRELKALARAGSIDPRPLKLEKLPHVEPGEQGLVVWVPVHLPGIDGEGKGNSGEHRPRVKGLQIVFEPITAQSLRRVSYWQLIASLGISLGFVLMSWNLLQKEKEDIKKEKLAEIGLLMAGIAHEVRNPVAAVKGLGQLLLMDESDPEKREYLQSIVEESGRLEEFAAILLTYTRSGILPVEPIYIKEIFEELAWKYGPERLIVEMDKQEARVLANGEALRHVLLNLLQNAWQVMGRKEEALVVKFREEKDWLWVDIFDRGPGFGEKVLQMEGLMESDKPGGYGLGLALSRKITELMGGELILANYNGGGRVTLKLRRWEDEKDTGY
ncbi:Signal transduction histidine kinase [Carboxydocella thermautotrophica]|nr:Signal transduction histidine kinase [Carboxydocella thermautotrophica]